MSDIELASVNGTIGALRDAVIPISDHGFLYGDSVYETVRTYGGRPWLLPQHLDRLARSAEAIRLKVPPGIAEEIARLIAAAPSGPEFALRIMATRGVGPLGYDPSLCPVPGLVLLLRELPPPPASHLTGVPA